MTGFSFKGSAFNVQGWWNRKKSNLPFFLDSHLRGNDKKTQNSSWLQRPSYPRRRVSRH